MSILNGRLIERLTHTNILQYAGTSTRVTLLILVITSITLDYQQQFAQRLSIIRSP